MQDIEAKRILVPVSGKPTDDEMIGLACTIARSNKGEVHAVYVIEVKRALALDADLPQDAEQGETVLERAERVAAEHKYEIQADLLQAREVGPTIVDEAIQRKADLILVGLPYKERFGEFDLGQTVPFVLKHAPCRVWVCRGAVD
jgi:nucleotide-binding universal stress UspA family protein